MILKGKQVPDRTMLKLVAKILRNSPLPKGYKVNTGRGSEKVTSDEVIQFVEDLSEALYKGRYVEIRKCKTCEHFSPEWCKQGRGWCPKFAGYKTSRDFCSEWSPQTEQQKEIQRRLHDEFGQLQTQRAGDGSEDSKKGNRPADGTKAKRRSDSKQG